MRLVENDDAIILHQVEIVQYPNHWPDLPAGSYRSAKFT
jgi:hypothetical protein